ncbi:MAG: hypothetical protein IIV74_03245 [Alphaproteobacteria bacterium]|nr:hypothetical protein [Alphaproteobacteria bacterium]
MFFLFRQGGVFVLAMFVSAMLCTADAVTTRGGASNARTVAGGAATARMPSMPTLPIISVGNISNNLPSGGDDRPDVPPVGPDEPDVPDEPEEPGDTDKSECPDGGVKNSEYTVEMCMNDVLRCINNGALPNGLNDMFNEELRHAIVNGMGLCAVHVEKCVTEVRRDCENVYRSAADVWIDFNSRKVQPEYYSFVLRKTGLTPNQAENTCRLLDKNTYGSSFTAVDNAGRTTEEYNQKIGAYNSQRENTLIKKNPQGVKVNDGNPGVDGARGHYARWDAATATCLIRVAAYNKDKHISNSWLFGAVGDDTPAEVWKAAGESFSCNKDLFGFSLLNDTRTVAVVGVGGGTLVGAGVGAIAGHGARSFDCSRDNHREMLMGHLKNGRVVGILNEYIIEDVDIKQNVLSKDACDEIVELFDKYYQYETAIKECRKSGVTEIVNLTVTIEETVTEEGAGAGTGNANSNMDQEAASVLAASVASQAQNAIAGKLDNCLFDTFNLDKMDPDKSIYVAAFGKTMNAAQVARELQRLDSVFGEDFSDLMINGEKSNIGKSVAIGAAVGAGTGGLATAITAFVERNNISCHVGDGLEQVAFGKSHTIDTLKDFYVKWNLRVPDVVAPTATISDCKSWKNTCATFADLEQCENAQFNYKPAGASTTTLIRSVCAVSGSACIENYPVAKSYGACP